MNRRRKLTEAEKLDALAIEARFEEAVYTLRRLQVSHTRPMEYFSTWPDIVYSEWEVMQQDRPPLRLGPPTPSAISEMEQVFEWLLWLEVSERHLVWWRAANKPWKLICREAGYSRTTAWRKWAFALYKISYRLKTAENKGK